MSFYKSADVVRGIFRDLFTQFQQLLASIAVGSFIAFYFLRQLLFFKLLFNILILTATQYKYIAD